MTIFGLCALILAVAGLAVLVLALLGHERTRRPWREAGLVVLVRDRADAVEGAYHQLLAAAGRAGYQWSHVMILDDRSADETPLILDRLTRRYPGVEARAATATEASFLSRVTPPGRTTLIVNMTRGDVRTLAGMSVRPLRAAGEREEKESAK